VQDVLAAEPAAAAAGEISIGQGLALLGIGLPTGLAAIGAAIAMGPIGSAALAVIAEKPEMFGRTLIYIGLAEGIAIYGLVMSILLLGKI
ncbi:MAG: ATP synthase subunit C, partial [Thiobacillus sp.]